MLVIRSRPAALLAVLMMAATLPAQVQAQSQKAAPRMSPQGTSTMSYTSGIDRSAMDPSVRAQDDLWNHVNGRWLAATAFPPDKAYIGIAQQLTDRTRGQLRELIEA